MDINFNDLTHVIHACFILHNFCEIRNESISQQEVKATIKYGREFQPPRQSGYNVGTNELSVKKPDKCLSNILRINKRPLKYASYFIDTSKWVKSVQSQ